jgi:hypothetical protein
VIEACLLALGNGHNFGAEDPVPETASDTETILIVQKVMLEMVLLEVLIPEGEVSVMEEIVGQIVADIAENTATEDDCSDIPIVVE